MSSPGYSPRHLHPLYDHPARKRGPFTLWTAAAVLAVIAVATALLPGPSTHNSSHLARSGFTGSVLTELGLVLLVGAVVLFVISELDYKFGFRRRLTNPPSESGDIKP